MSRTLCSIVAAGLLLASCGNPPTQPGIITQPPPGPVIPTRSTGPIAFASNRDGTSRIYLANEDGSLVTPVATGWSPAWARDGRQIAFGVGNFEIRVIGADSAGERVIADRGQEPAWSPDGRQLVFADWSTFSTLELVNFDGSSRRSLFEGKGFLAYRPKWSPDGRRVLFSISNGYVDGCFGLWTVNADGSDARQLGGSGIGRPSGSCFDSYDNALSDAYEAAWSPDGSAIAFRSDAGIEVVRADGSGRQLRVPGPAWDPEWTPDGRLIYAKGPFNSPQRIFISDGKTERQLIPDVTGPARPGYSDGQVTWRR